MTLTNTTPPRGMQTIYIDIMEGQRFLCQLPYRYCPLWPLDLETIGQYVYEKKPSLRNRNIHMELSANRVI